MALVEIDATKPVDGVPARKSELRDNLSIAKRKAGEKRSLGDFGAAMDGSTNDTAAFNSAISWLAASAGSGRTLYISGNTFISPASLNWKLYYPNNTSIGTDDVSNCSLLVDGTIWVDGTLRLPSQFSIIGRSGSSGVQFQNGRSCQINRFGTFTGPVVQLSGREGLYNRLENVTIGSNPNGPNLRIGYSGTETGFASAGQTYNVWLRDVGASCDQTGQSAVELFNVFWVWVHDFSFLAQADSYAAVRIGGVPPAAGNNSGGLVHLENGVISGMGIVMDASYINTGGYESFYTFRNIHYESCHGPFLHVKRTGGGRITQILYDNVEAADSVSGNNALLFMEPTSNNAVVQSVFFRMCPCVWMAGIGGDMSKISSVHWDGGGQSVYELGASPILPDAVDSYPRGTFIEFNGGMYGQLGFGPSSIRPQFVPAGCTAATASALNGLTIDQGAGSVATGHLAPDGTTTAIQITTTAASSRLSAMADTGITLLNGDYLVFGAFVRFISTTGFLSGSGGLADVMLAANLNGGTGGFEQAGAFTHYARIGAGRHGYTGWNCLWEVVRYVASGSTQQATLHMKADNTGVFKVWGPFLVRVPASLGWKRQDVIAYASTLTGPPQGGGAGVVAQYPTHAFKTGSGATGSRPSAAAVGKGAQWFDTSLNSGNGLPIWSDGTNWRNAAGTTV